MIYTVHKYPQKNQGTAGLCFFLAACVEVMCSVLCPTISSRVVPEQGGAVRARSIPLSAVPHSVI